MEKLTDIDGKWICSRILCCRNSEGYLPDGYCDKALCQNRIVPLKCHNIPCKYYENKATDKCLIDGALCPFMASERAKWCKYYEPTTDKLNKQ